MTVIIFTIVSVMFLAAGGLVAKRYGHGRGHEKAVADDALRKLYWQYWAQARMVAQKHLLDAPDDEQWLAGIRERAASAGSEDPPLDPVRPAPRPALWSLLAFAVPTIPVVITLLVQWASNDTIAATVTLFAFFIVLMFFLPLVLMAAALRSPNRHLFWPGQAADPVSRGVRQVNGIGERGSPHRPDGAPQA